MDYIQEGEKEVLPDGTLVERNEGCIVVHNVPSDKGILKNAVLENWIKELIENKDLIVKDLSGEDILAKKAILKRVKDTCSAQWGIHPDEIEKALSVIYLTPLYSSAISEPTLNHSSKNCKDCAKDYCEKEKLYEFSLEDLLYAIEALHGCGKYLSHPYIQLHGDGSGSVIGRYKDELGRFQNLREFIEIANSMMKEMEGTAEDDSQLKLDF